MRTLRSRPAFTLLELLVSMALMLMVFAMVVPFFRVQLRSISKNAGRLDAQQNVRFALASIQRELRVAGGGVVDAQPMIVQADGRAITFNVDLVTQDSADPSAVYYDKDADPAFTTSLRQSQKIVLPGSSFQYPDTTYWEAAGITSRAETISYWATPDVQNSGQYILYRRVNNGDSTIVSSGIVLSSGQPIFRYFTLDSASGGIAEISPSALPLYHSAAVHGSPADTAASALTDAIRVVQVDLYGAMTDPDTHTLVKRHLQGSIRLLNAGLVRHATCGEPPIGASAVSVALAADHKSVEVSWDQSIDEASGEKDVERYLIFRRTATGSYGEAIASVAGGLSTYTYSDFDVQPGDVLYYGIAAEDCTPASSALSEGGPVTVLP